MSVVLAYEKIAAHPLVSHIGFGMAAINTAKVLRREGVSAEVWPALNAADLRNRLRIAPQKHVILSETLIAPDEMEALCRDFPQTRFAVNCHADIGFSQTDRKNETLIRKVIGLGVPNIRLAGSSRQFCESVKAEFGAACDYLPNLYWMQNNHRCPQRSFHGGTLRIGMFGAVKPLKSLVSAAGAALQIARNLRAPLELWLSAGRAEGGGEAVLAAAREALQNAPDVKFVMSIWASWEKFRRTVGGMHLLLQPNCNEAFNIVTADGIAEGIPSVVSRATNWMPESWKAQEDDTMNMAQVGQQLLHDSAAPSKGLEALRKYVQDGVHAYQSYFAA